MLEKIEIITKNRLSSKDIADYLNCSISKANNLKKKCIKEYDGTVPAFPSMTTKDAFLKCLNTTLEKELTSLKGQISNN